MSLIDASSRADDGWFNVYYGTRDEEGTDMDLQLLASFPSSLGYQYRALGSIFPEIVGARATKYTKNTKNTANGAKNETQEGGRKRGLDSDKFCSFHTCGDTTHIPGRLMGYSATGTVDEQWMHRVRLHYFGISNNVENQNFPYLGSLARLPLEDEFSDIKVQRNLAATVQNALENIVRERLAPFIDALPHVEGIVVGGGCALNIKVNSYLQR